MNLHICSDEKFIDQLYNRFQELGILNDNKFVCNARGTKLRNISADIPFAKLDSKKFNDIIGETESYDNVYIHCLSPGYYFWIIKNKFKSLNWLVWGSDLYNQSFSRFQIYEPITASLVRNYRNDYYEKLRIYVKNFLLRPFALKKVNKILTWMPFEYELAKKFSSESAVHDFFFYENKPFNFNTSAHNIVVEKYFILGNSCTFSNNHLDAVDYLDRIHFKDKIVMPLSYGKMNYKKILKKMLASKSHTFQIDLLEDFLTIDKYASLLNNSSGFIFNNIRPQAVGNIWLAMALEKPIFINEKNPLYTYLNSIGYKVFGVKDLEQLERVDFSGEYLTANKLLNEKMFTGTTSDKIYLKLFSLNRLEKESAAAANY